MTEPVDTPDDLARLYDRHARPLHGYLARRVGSEAADDLVAEAFLVLWEQRHTFDPSRAGARAWLYGIATNLLRHHARSEVRRMRAWARHGWPSRSRRCGRRSATCCCWWRGRT
ncbi:RNA polymerase sigma factor [Actinosynnema sp. NPDC047251]|uniref:Putative RNA polymerase sigma (70) factor n=1 Tax=Saccharothrix espanaensis (strain ATCC 51144 / DSM 44229 / JCM 9112 / NBRC 15066 / NRRL 15764) TaxID=1179773 RepID=K0K8X6_SACES|nr:putative RNA polymerase sigma (70) factor [Saccharothrix espanaensis DSM 44229]